jgi:hypothetical protein
MIRPNTQRWDQTLDDLRYLSLHAVHPRTRERFLALFQIASGLLSASDWAQRIGRRPETVLGWVHLYNQCGPQALIFVRTGGPRPLFRRKSDNASSTRRNIPPRTTTACPAGAGL